MDELIGRTLGRYRIIKLLGEGGMGAVYKAEDHELKRNVAIKVMNAKYASRPDFGDLFRQEARATAALDHPNIVKVFDFGEDDGRPYLVMEFIAGATLRQLMRQMRDENLWLSAGESVALVRDVAFALEFAHLQGILHQDIKPGNIMLKQQGSIVDDFAGIIQPILMDLGLARIQGGQDVQGRAGTSFGGTPAYMSPEQAFGEEVHAASDIYSLGVLLYELVIGRVPFVIRNYDQARDIHRNQPPPTASSVRPDIDPALEEVLLTALAKSPKQRYGSAAEMGMALQSLPDHIFYLTVPPTATEGTAELPAVHLQSLDHTPAPLTPTPMQSASTSSRHTTYQVVVSGADNKPFGLANTKNRVQIGRDPVCDLTLDDPQLSRVHATIEFDGSGYHVTDERSANGVFLGTRRLHAGQSVRWPPGTQLRMGNHVFALKPVAEDELPPPPIPKNSGSASTYSQIEKLPAAMPVWRRAGALLTGLIAICTVGIGFLLWQVMPMNNLIAFGDPTATPTVTNTNTPTPAPTETPADTPTDAPTDTPTDLPTPTKTVKPTSTPASSSASDDDTPTRTPRPTATRTQRPTRTATPRNTSTPRPTSRLRTPTPKPANTSSPDTASSSGSGITSPRDGATVSGNVKIQGNANHPRFERWQLNIADSNSDSEGSHLYTSSQRTNGQFSWILDTTKYPNGKYRLWLRVVKDDSNYDRYSITIKIDN